MIKLTKRHNTYDYLTCVEKIVFIEFEFEGLVEDMSITELKEFIDKYSILNKPIKLEYSSIPYTKSLPDGSSIQRAYGNKKLTDAIYLESMIGLPIEIWITENLKENQGRLVYEKIYNNI